MSSDHGALARPDQRSLLFIASGSAEHVHAALRTLRMNFPYANIDVVARHDALAAVATIDSCTVVHVTGTASGRRSLVQRLRQTGYPTVAFVETGTGGFIALQALPFLLGIRDIFLVDEHGSIVHAGFNLVFLWHATQRLRHHWRNLFYSTGRNLLRTIITPIGLAILVYRTIATISYRRM